MVDGRLVGSALGVNLRDCQSVRMYGATGFTECCRDAACLSGYVIMLTIVIVLMDSRVEEHCLLSGYLLRVRVSICGSSGEREWSIVEVAMSLGRVVVSAELSCVRHLRLERYLVYISTCNEISRSTLLHSIRIYVSALRRYVHIRTHGWVWYPEVGVSDSGQGDTCEQVYAEAEMGDGVRTHCTRYYGGVSVRVVTLHSLLDLVLADKDCGLLSNNEMLGRVDTGEGRGFRRTPHRCSQAEFICEYMV
ncbi:hypothetical protein Tco_1070467 [Tanacetum coccineum]|uniref:Uncharacterized protein n=1 Tax=Tanacetum coccineum TaxID=301880 RepID=A0ABQ5HLT1_9ASTR